LKAQTEDDDSSIAIRRVADEFLAAYNASDLDRICSLMTPGAILMPPDEPARDGIEEIRSRFEAFFSGFTFAVELYPILTNVAGNVAFERGSYAASALLKGEAGEPKGGYGDYLLIFERQLDGQWKIGAFGTNAARGTPPRNIAGPDRLLDLIEDAAVDVEPCDEEWASSLSERYTSKLSREAHPN
jgi:ketosteroid isomerase-like protein